MNELDAAREDHPIKRTIADSVFTNLFGNRKYLLQFYQALHPDDTDIKEDDLSVITIENVLTDGQYNDLGATVRSDKMIFLCEAQSTWSLNVLIRILMYLAEHEKEVVNIMGTLFGAEEISRIHDANIRKDASIKSYIEAFEEMELSKEDVAMRVSMKFNLSDDAARDAINEYWK